MYSEEQRQEEHAVRQILSEALGETSRRRRDIYDIVPPFSTRSEQNESSFEYSETFHDYNINICVDIIETDYQEVENEFADSLVELEGAKVFPCSNCSRSDDAHQLETWRIRQCFILSQHDASLF